MLLAALRRSIRVHNDKVAKLLLTSKEILKKRSMIELAFRACKEAFMEISIVLLELLEERSNTISPNFDCIKKVVLDALHE